jgi:hypothetical protein
MPSLKDIRAAPGRIVLGAKVVGVALVVIVALQGAILWLLLTRLPAS